MMWWYDGVMVWGGVWWREVPPLATGHGPYIPSLDTDTTRTPSHTSHCHTDTTRTPSHTSHYHTYTTRTPSHTSQCHTDTTLTPSHTLHCHTDTTNTMAHVTLSHGHHHDTITHVTRHILFCIRYLGGEVTNDPQTFFRRGASVSLSGFNNTDQRQSGLWKDFSKVFPVMAEIWEPRGAKRKWYRYGRKLLS